MNPSLDPRTFEVHARSVQEAEAFYQGRFPALRVEGRAEGFRLDLTGIQVDGLRCIESSMSCGGGFTREAEYDGYVLSQYLRGGVSYVGPTGAAWRAGAGEFQMVDGLAVDTAWRLPGTRLQSVWADAALLHAHVAAVSGRPPARRLRFSRDLGDRVPAAHLVMSLAGLLREGLGGSAPLLEAPVALRNLREAVVGLMVEGLPNDHQAQVAPSPRAAAVPRSIRIAIDFMHAHAHEPITAADIAAAACCSIRALQAGFQRHHRSTPTAYLRDIRLRGVRQELLTTPDRARPSIRAIAYRWGFFHMGLFARRYREAFGERPTDTLRHSVHR